MATRGQIIMIKTSELELDPGETVLCAYCEKPLITEVSETSSERGYYHPHCATYVEHRNDNSDYQAFLSDVLEYAISKGE